MTPSSKIFVTKYNGELVPYNENKLKHSLERSGATKEVIDTILLRISNMLYDGIPTNVLYKTAFQELKKAHSPFAAKYKLKKALFELGPTGFPFEKYVAKLLEYQGFKTHVGVIVKGHCVDHEVDVVAEKDNQHFMVECKFHSDKNRFCNVKVPLYIQSRFLDVERQWKKQPGHNTKFHQGWIVTNTRFTTDAIQFGKCMGLNLISWDYPKQGNLKDRIDFSGLHPITCLTTITKNEKQQLLDLGTVLCKELCQNQLLLSKIAIPKTRQNRILKEAKELCNE
ncbi:MAG: hypothetical protein Kow0079_08420 [Vicingaceae bacterium]